MPRIPFRQLTSRFFVHRATSYPFIVHNNIKRPLRFYSAMSDSQEMAVVAPDLTSNLTTLATHAPQVQPNGGGHANESSDEEMPLSQKTSQKPNGANGKRVASSGSSSSESDRPLTKKPRVSAGIARKRIVDSDSDEEEAPGPSSPLSSPAKPLAKANGSSKPPPRAKAQSSDSELSSDGNQPLAKRQATNGARASSSASPIKKSKAKPRPSYKESPGSSESEEEKPLAKKKKAPAPRKSSASTSAAKKVKPEPVSDDDIPLVKGKKRASTSKDVKPKKEETGKVKKEKKVKDEDDEDTYRWWEQQENDGSVKWTTFVHNGVLFPPSYNPLPKNVKMKYEGVALTLPPESEEVAGFYGAMLETDHVLDSMFQKNFFNDFKAMLKEYPPKEVIKVTELEKCDFRPMYEHFEKEREKKKAMTKEDKKAIKEAKDKLEEPYLYALVDGRKEKLGNFRAEPPGLFRGRGEHPRKGTLKRRLRPEDIILNIGKDSPIPKPNIPGNWKGVQHDNTVTWLAHWKENVNKQAKYVFLAASSSWKGQSDRSKFEKARELIKYVDGIRKDYNTEMRSKVMAERQRATALYFIDRLALRAGNEKGDDEADTYGCCSLLFEHVTLSPPNTVIFDFLGKDSMRFHQEVEVDIQVFKNIKIFKAEPKKKGDDIFDRLTTTGLNSYLNQQMKGLSAKVFRTYNASWTFQQQLKNTPKDGTVQEKIAAYNTANREVAILCNHQKTVSKNFEQSFAKMGDKVRALKYQRMKLRYQLFTLEPKMKKKRPELAEEESDMDDEFMERHEEELREKALEGAKKKFERENVKLEGEKEKAQPKSILDERLKEIKAEFKELAKERKSKKVEPKKGASVEKIEEQIIKMDARIAAARVQMEDRDKTKDVALGTSKINYIDPRLTVTWARKYEVPLEKLFSKTLREKFPWAEAEADADWLF